MIPFFAFAPEVRKILYTKAVQSLRPRVRKAEGSTGIYWRRGSDRTDLAVLVLRKVHELWKVPRSFG